MMISSFHAAHYQIPENDSGCIAINLYLSQINSLLKLSKSRPKHGCPAEDFRSSHVGPALNVAAPPVCAMWSIPWHTWHETIRRRVVTRYMLIINKL